MWDVDRGAPMAEKNEGAGIARALCASTALLLNYEELPVNTVPSMPALLSPAPPGAQFCGVEVVNANRPVPLSPTGVDGSLVVTVTGVVEPAGV